MTFRIVICGRPNVGKSTLLNRLAGRRLALVDNQPGITRDWREAEGRLWDLRFTIIDTAGLEDAKEGLEAAMRVQTERALEGAGVALFMFDARTGLTPLDTYFAGWLRKRGTPVIAAANKCERGAGKAALGEAHALGLGEPVALSAAHGEGLDELYDRLAALAPPEAFDREDPEAEEGAGESADEDEDESADEAPDNTPIRMAVIGRPNVGKSTLVNRLLGKERMLTGPNAGVTRDSVAATYIWKGREIQLADTAGIRRNARVSDRVERMSVEDARRAVRFAQVVVLVTDATQGLDKQDLAVAKHATDEGRALIVCLNKWDAVHDRPQALKRVYDRLQTSLAQVPEVPVVTLSALTGAGVPRLTPAAAKIHKIWSKRIGTPRLNRWLEAMLAAHPPPLASGRRVKLRYITQAKTRPPTFAVFGSQVKALPESYTRYLAGGLREAFKLTGIPLRILLRQGKNPYTD
ncbi:MAG: ribosome biogenesis GTPase Der [Rhodospirillales bacterium]